MAANYKVFKVASIDFYLSKLKNVDLFSYIINQFALGFTKVAQDSGAQ